MGTAGPGRVTLGRVMEVHHIAASVTCLAACVCDLRTRRIPNVLTFGTAGLGVVFHGLAGGLGAVGGSFAGWLLGAALLVPLFWLGGMGAGDVKLLAPLGAWVGPGDVVWVAFWSAVAGGAIGVPLALAHGYLREACRNILVLLRHWLVAGLRPLPEITLQRSLAPRLAYAVPMMAGLVVTLWRL